MFEYLELYNGLAGAMPRFVSCMKFVRSNIGHLMHSIKSIQLISIQQKGILEIPTLTLRCSIKTFKTDQKLKIFLKFLTPKGEAQ